MLQIIRTLAFSAVSLFLFSTTAALAIAEASEPGLEARQAGTTGYGYMGCFGDAQNSPFSDTVTEESFGPTVILNPACAALCRQHNTQYYATIDYPNACYCGNTIPDSVSQWYSTACKPCGATGETGEGTNDENYTPRGPGFCGDYWDGGAAIYSLNF